MNRELQLWAQRAMKAEKVRGFVKMNAWKRGKHLWTLERENIFTTSGLGPIALLAGGTVTNNSMAVIGFGSGTSITPLATDVDLTATPVYYKAITSPTFPTTGQCQFSWALTYAGDTAADGMVIGELGFFSNTGAISLPLYRASGAAPNLTMWAHEAWPTFTLSSGSSSYSATWTFIA